MYSVIIHRKAQASFNTLPSSYQKKVKEIIHSLTTNPFGYPYTKIKGIDHIYRIRCGEWRILYEVDPLLHRLIILKIEIRSKVYK